MSGIVESRVLETRKGFNKQRWQELYDNPPKTLEGFKGVPFHVDPDFFRKCLQYSYDMLFKILDIFGLHGGIEGSGKSTDASQVGKIFHYIFTECNIIREDLGTYYEYNEDNCLAHNLSAFLDICDKYNDDLFRIIICDEAGDLKSEDRWEESNKIFRDDMRKDRKKLRVRLLCYPQPFELVRDFNLGRNNFMRINKFSKSKDGLGSIPNKVDTIILPRGEYTYSFHTKELIKREEMKKVLLEVTKERYTKEFPKKYIFKTSRKDDVFCFDAQKYIKKAKEENRIRRKQEKVYLSNALIKIIAENLTSGKIGLSTKIDKTASKEEQEEQLQEKRKAQLISKLVNTCREKVKLMEKKKT